MRRAVDNKWRPPLALVLGGSLLAVLILPVLGLFVVDALDTIMERSSAVFLVVLGAVSATIVLGWLLWRLILGPVRALARRAETIRGGHEPEKMKRYGTPEIGDLAETVLGMADVLRTRELQVRSYTDHVTHELKTPLTAIRGAAELLGSDEGLSDSNQKLIRTIQDAEVRAERLLAAARDIASARSPDHHGSSTLGHLDGKLSMSNVEVSGKDIALPLTDDGLLLVLTHLIENAKAAGASNIRIAAHRTDQGAELSIQDDGPGISAGNKDRIFEPFFTTKRDTGGTGMGLAIVHTMLLAHGASIELEPSEEGASFRIRF